MSSLLSSPLKERFMEILIMEHFMEILIMECFMEILIMKLSEFRPCSTAQPKIEVNW